MFVVKFAEPPDQAIATLSHDQSLLRLARKPARSRRGRAGHVGAQLASPKLQPLVLVRDGAFQMIGMELATVARYGLNPVVVVLNNRGLRHGAAGCLLDVHLQPLDRSPALQRLAERLARNL